ncbi:MAG: UDP-N-acetylmuramoyl-L-alanine--D-glutamate ligase [Deltaproteobacteria bacterium]|nr:UDP-N-acetylmuramoyl-L-alanine--D-glutamate ligase [Deltaproteobacteria bacterium]
MLDYAHKNVLVIGAGLSGLAAARLLRRLGSEVTVADAKEEKYLSPLETIKGEEVTLLLGGDFPKSVKDYDLVVISPGVPIDHKLLKEARKKGIEITGELELSSSLVKMPTVAVTGSNGKTTTAELTRHILYRLGYRPHLAGNIGEPLSNLAADLIEGKNNPYRTLVLEVSSFQLETIKDFHPKGAALLNLSPDHLDRHHSMSKYLKLKKAIFKNQTKEDIAVVNLDDPALQNLKPKARVFGITEIKDHLNFGGCLTQSGLSTVLKLFEDGSELSSVYFKDFSLTGRHNFMNILAAVGLAHSLGADMVEALNLAKDFKPSDHRLQLVLEHRSVQYYDDSKGTNPGAVASALANFRDGSVLLIMGGRDKDMDFRGLMNLVKRKVKLLILMGESREKIREQLSGAAPTAYAESMEKAVELGRAWAASGDTVLLSPACASFDMFKDYKERGDVFQKEVMKILETP